MKRSLPINAQAGFALPTLMILSIALFAIGLTIFQDSSSIRVSLSSQYYNALAREAAEAGISYADGCYKKNKTITWSDAKPLKPSTDCNGDTNGLPNYIIQQGNIRTTFQINNTVIQPDGSLTHSAQGTAEFINTTTGIVLRSYPYTLKGLTPADTFVAKSIISGHHKVCSILIDGPYCWGDNDVGQLGDGNAPNNSLTPVKVRLDPGVLLGKNITMMSSGYRHTCALADGEVYCWGSNSDGQLGDNSLTNRHVPTKVLQEPGGLAGKVIVEITGMEWGSCARAATGEAYCWGENDNGQLGIGSSATHVAKPVRVGGPLATLSVSGLAAGSHQKNMCAIAAGEAYCWGDNSNGQLGDNSLVDRNIPVKVQQDIGLLAGKTVTSITTNGDGGSNIDYSTCAIAAGEVYCWGANTDGQLGDGTNTQRLTPVKVGGLLAGKTVTQLGNGTSQACALADGEVYSWGYGNSGSLGDGTWVSKNSPVKVLQEPGKLGGATITTLVAGGLRCCVIADKITYCWGINNAGQIGDGTTTSRNKPTESTYLRPKRPNFLF